jgi:GNAT superfamily N-acetyltransferase
VTDFKLRELTSADTDLMWEAIGWALAFQSDKPDLKQAHEVAPMVVEEWGRPDDIGLIAFADAGEFAGAAWVRRFEVVPALAIGLPPSFRGQSLGTQLLRGLMALVKSHGHTQMTLGVVKKNVRARATHEKVGFKEAGDGLYGLLNMVAEL